MFKKFDSGFSEEFVGCFSILSSNAEKRINKNKINFINQFM